MRSNSPSSPRRDSFGVCQASETDPSRAGRPRPCPSSPSPATSEIARTCCRVPRRRAGATAVPPEVSIPRRRTPVLAPPPCRRRRRREHTSHRHPGPRRRGLPALFIALRSENDAASLRLPAAAGRQAASAQRSAYWPMAAGERMGRSIRGQEPPMNTARCTRGRYGSARLLGGEEGEPMRRRDRPAAMDALPGGKERSGAAERVTAGHQNSEPESSRECHWLAPSEA